jgi:protease PrsW
LNAQTSVAPRPGRMTHWRWLFILLGGLALWVTAIAVTAVTLNANLIPTDVLLGSFLVPVAAVVWTFDHEATSELTAQRIFYAFVAGGVLGVLAASVLEALLIQDGPLMYLSVGLIEEFVKLGALVVVAWGLKRYTTRDGIALGAAVGFGFAALESSGYALNSLFTQHGVSLLNLVQTEVLRAVLAPVGHGLWTAIVGGVLFHAASHSRRLRLSLGLVAAYLLVALLHALWDSMRGIAIVITLFLTATPGQILLLERGQVPPVTDSQAGLFLLIQIAGMAFDALVGIGVLVAVWRGLSHGEARA